MCLLLWLAYAAARWVSAHTYRLVHVGTPYGLGSPAGRMFWLTWNVLPGS